ncbi:hypothetical protein [Candidatus Absconditicoccus praedator]|uniref:hypothetical protein n=1 Tax=Candidatus Absconditicoccus praedator TaxID=2735562 RepID=UPI001E4BF54F|nr:hypothetical protein [Candidatus Absconditicoccus praedator]UFX83175.1 hypothetical protein HLG78_03510 [Candidatus Absconditicoccus praedator]
MLLLVDKPYLWTSFDVVKKIRNLLPKKTKVGHSGTLDPMATGLLVVGIGKGTKKLSLIQDMGKEYIAEIDFSVSSDTWDMQYHKDFISYDFTSNGIWKEGKFCEAPDISTVSELLDCLTPEKEMPLPAFSAKKKQGKKFYEMARKGDSIEAFQTMKFYDYKILSYDFPKLKIQIEVGSGTYIRSVAYWMGLQFGLGGALSGLQRTKIGEFSLEDAYNLDQLTETVLQKFIS